jgi:hypothetical protein
LQKPPNSSEGVKWTHIPGSRNVFQGTDTQKQFRDKNGNSGKLSFEQVNEITWKLTNGEMTNVPACHGFWGGYRTTKAIAWVDRRWSEQTGLACTLQGSMLRTDDAQGSEGGCTCDGEGIGR